MPVLGRIASIVRYPVKSMAGENIQKVALTPFGLYHDRRYAFESTRAPSGMLRLAGRERREMLRYEAATNPLGQVDVLTPTHDLFPIQSNELLTYLQQHIPEAGSLTLTEFDTPQTEVRPLSLISYQTVDQLSRELGEYIDPIRFRANLYLDLPSGPFTEDSLVGMTVRLGATASVKITERDPRCRLITYNPKTPQSSPPLYSLMKLLDRLHEGRAGVYGSVVSAGTVELLDPIRLDSEGIRMI